MSLNLNSKSQRTTDARRPICDCGRARHRFAFYACEKLHIELVFLFVAGVNAEVMLRPLRPCRPGTQAFWLICFAAVSLAVALPLRRFEFNESYYQEPSGVFNPAAVWNPLVGWVVVFRWDRCFYQRCGIHHTETTVCHGAKSLQLLIFSDVPHSVED